jgi:enoyl-CoA hydratase
MRAGLIERVVPASALASEARDDALRLARQPGFRAVKRQVRGALANRVATLASLEEPHLSAFLA